MNYCKMEIIIVMLLAALGAVKSEIDITKINANGLQSQLPAEFANTNLTLDDAKNLFRDKCVDVAGKEKGEEAFKEIETATMNLGECISNIINYTAIQAEIEEASPRGELDVVFNKYCNKRPEAIECVEAFNVKLEPCLDTVEKENQDVFMRIVRSLLNFVCHKGGDQIALFIAEKGPECLESKKDEIQQCINITFSSYMPKEGIENMKSLPKFVMGPQECDDMAKLESCVVEKLETCQEITPANIVESMFRFIKNETICRTSQALPHQKNTNNGVTLNISGKSFAVFLFLGFLVNAVLALVA